MERYYLDGVRVRLRALEPEDVEFLCEIENCPANWDVSNFSVPYSRYVMEQYVTMTQSDLYADRQVRLAIEHKERGCAVGTVDVTDFSPRHMRGEVGISLLQEFRGSGLGREALLLMCEYVFGFLRFHQLQAHIEAGNMASLKLFRSCGFQECGVLREWWLSGGEYRDVVMLQCLREEWMHPHGK